MKNGHAENPRGQMQPFNREDVELIRRTLKARNDLRQLALFSLGIDAILRGGDLVRLRVSDIAVPIDTVNPIRETIVVRQMKTGKAVRVYLSDATRKVAEAYIKAEDKWQSDWLFTASRDPHAHEHLSEKSLRRYVKDWARIAHRDPERYSSHSLRRTRPALIYAETNNIEAVRQLLGHSSVTTTSHYLNVTAKDVEAIARRYEI